MNPLPPPLLLSPRDEEILRAVAQFRYMTARDVAALLFSPRILNYVRSRLARLAEGIDLAPDAYLCRFQLPALSGMGEKIFALGARGRDFLQREAGLPVDWSFRPAHLRHFSFSHLLHALVLTRVAVAASAWSRQQPVFTLTHTRLSYELARLPGLTVVPDGWLLFTRVADGAQFPILLEIDRGTEGRDAFRKHLTARLDFIRSGEYARVYGVPAVILAFATTVQLPTYRETRRQTLCTWIRDVLTELKLEEWTSVFRVTSLVHAEILQTPLFDAPVWYRPDASAPLPLLSPTG